jgi:2'-hydroxyisoflavone reductase
VTTFTRGQTNPGLWDAVEELHGDRDGDLSALEGREWDAVVDTSGYFPRIVRASAEHLAGSVGNYTFVSSISVYADLSVAVDESSPVGTLEDETVEEFGDDFQHYGPLKALCERAVQDVHGDRALIIRPGFIVGPHDPTDRFTYWPRRALRRGEMLAPGPAERPMQFVDARDLAAWMVQMVEERRTGVYNAANEGVPWSAVLGDAEVVWVPDAFLRENGVSEEHLPLWTAEPDFAAILEADVSAAVAAGLTFRPVEETVRDTLEWHRSRGEPELVTGMSAEHEAELLAAWKT